MKISVCMATFNGEQYIGEQLGSIIPQLADQDELVISDDSSTDRTLRIIEGFGNAHLRLFSGNIFHSPVYNIENAVKHAEGDIIVLSDQDDVWLSNKLPLIRSHFSRRMSAVSTLVLDGYVINQHGRATGDTLFHTLKPGKGVIRNLYRNTYMGCCMAFTRELLRIALPFPPNIPMHDSWLGILSELYGSVEFMPEKTINYRRHPLNQSLQRFAVGQQIRWRIFLAYHLLKRTASRPSGLFAKK
jgi:glycosyltransferase involved in cell wall biosynthesis